MIDMIVLVSIHGLLLFAAYRLTTRDDLDEDPMIEGDEPGGRGAGNAP
ncbi:hypothetical protein [Alteriqipengyuania sp. 357]